MKNRNILSNEKKELRASVLSRLPSVPNREKREREVSAACLALAEKVGAKKVGVYLSGKGELSLDPLINDLFDRPVRVYAPVVVSESDMVFVEIKKGEPFALNRFGLREPILKDEREEDFDVLFIPLAAFDENKNRLGKGKGYYDRFLQGKTTLKVGVAFIEQKVEKVPTEETDVPLDLVIYQ